MYDHGLLELIVRKAERRKRDGRRAAGGGRAMRPEMGSWYGAPATCRLVNHQASGACAPSQKIKRRSSL